MAWFVVNNHALQNSIRQGFSLNVTLFIKVINKLPKIIPVFLKTIMTAIYTAKEVTSIHQKHSQITPQKLAQKWKISVGFKFRPVKSKIILFHIKKNTASSSQLFINNINIPATNDLKILGVNFHKHLNWFNHQKILKAK